MFQWDWLGAISTVGVLASVLLAWVVYRTRPDRTQNRRLALFLVLVSLQVYMVRGFRLLLTEPSDSLAAGLIASVVTGLVFAAYPFFLVTLPSPLARPLRAPWLMRLLVALGLGFSAVVILFYHNDLFFVRVERFPHLDAWSFVPTPLFLAFNFAITAVPALYGLAVALTAVPFASSAVARRQAVAYAAAFAFHDVLFLWEPFSLAVWPGIAWVDSTRLGNVQLFVTGTARQVVFPLLLGYGILKTQLFDIDLKVKFALRSTTVAAIFIAAFFAVSELSAALLEDRTGSTVIGILATAALLLFIAPLQRLADRVSDAAMPNVRDTEQYRMVKKRDVYRHAVESALEDGMITERERDILATLADELGLSAGEARRLERSILQPS